jgi:hypothetical protein|uniref:Uncharacterized protein n=1 Tax=Thermocrispum agreste TaxID=37925 RepID=A0A2W4IWM4_9PSEU|nr:MAG: hypothetical protein DIU77_17330 [Thermocrispum agreste]
MTAWLVSEDGFRLARVDSVVSVTLDVVNDRDDPTKYHPTKWLARAPKVRLMVGIQGNDAMCALTCPGRDAAEALKQLVATLAETQAKHDQAGDTVFVHAMYVHWPSPVPRQLWQVTRDMPDQEWIRR